MPAPIAMSARLATRTMLVRRAPLHLGIGRDARNAHAREPTAPIARSETVKAVPRAIAKVPSSPAHSRPSARANTSNSSAPVQGLMPTEMEANPVYPCD